MCPDWELNQRPFGSQAGAPFTEPHEPGLYSHFNTENGKYTQRFLYIMLYYFNKGKNATEKKKKICALYGEGAVTERTCQKRFAKFGAGGFLLDDAPQSGRLVTVDSNQIKTLIQIVDILKISKSVRLLVKMKNMSFIFLWKKTK